MDIWKSTSILLAYAKRRTGFLNTTFARWHSAKTPTPTKGNIYFRQSPEESGAGRNYPLLIIPITTFCLGTWQLYRLRWKLGLIDERTTRMRNHPVTMEELPDDLDKIREMEYRRVKVTGQFDHEREVYLLPRSPLNSQGGGLVSNTSSHGAHVITPFKVADTETTILVDRGWVPKNRINPATRGHAQIPGDVTVVGVLRNSERRNNFSPENEVGSKNFQVRDLEEMAAALKTAPVYLDATKDNDIPGGPVGGQTIIQMRNEHLNYALTWYTLSALTALLWYFKYVKRRSFAR